LTSPAPCNRALWYRRFGEPDAVISLEESNLEDLSPGNIRVRMIASPINPSDLIPMTGAYGHRIQPPMIAGYDGVGTVVEAAPQSGYRIGQRVLPLRGGGTWQRYVDCNPAWAVPVPEDINDDLALRAYINPLAAFLMIRRWNPAGRTVLLTAANSTCAGLLAQWCLSAGAKAVVGIQRSADQDSGQNPFGIPFIRADDSAAVSALAANSDLIFDAVGGDLATRILAGAGPDATFVSYGLLSGKLPRTVAGAASPQRFHIRDHLNGLAPGLWQAWFAEIWPLLRRASLPPVERYPIDDWRHALAHFNTQGRRAKPVLMFGP
jgi:NADPH:quinone reductase-like Zn-dependent oxidoreductase